MAIPCSKCSPRTRADPRPPLPPICYVTALQQPGARLLGRRHVANGNGRSVGLRDGDVGRGRGREDVEDEAMRIDALLYLPVVLLAVGSGDVHAHTRGGEPGAYGLIGTEEPPHIQVALGGDIEVVDGQPEVLGVEAVDDDLAGD